jgi:transposase
LHPVDRQWFASKPREGKIGCIPQTLSGWVKQAEKDSGMRDGVTTEERDRIKTLERENRELRQANEILRKASAYFAPTLTHTSMCCRAAGRNSSAH